MRSKTLWKNSSNSYRIWDLIILIFQHYINILYYNHFILFYLAQYNLKYSKWILFYWQKFSNMKFGAIGNKKTITITQLYNIYYYYKWLVSSSTWFIYDISLETFEMKYLVKLFFIIEVISNHNIKSWIMKKWRNNTRI